MSAVIKVENVSKLYSLQEVGVASFKSDMKRWFARVRGQEDPAFKMAETNNRSEKGESNFVWALKDIDFHINQGDVLGIIGKNGAGKSTLLKLLSRVAAPTTGQIKMKGRLASLLEVGTGFHPELSGRDNIYLNGSILGMSKAEIKKNFDEIVDFSGVERYIDTPVKRYSSGMYVRLAFSVAAHLEPEILIIDEVLSVGDYEFQKKCMGKMKTVSSQGRTILFVSHNTTAIKSLCTTAILIEHGRIKANGSPNDLIDKYMSRDNSVKLQRNWDRYEQMPGNDLIRIRSAKIKMDNPDNILSVKTPFSIEVEFDLLKDEESFFVGIHLITIQNESAFVTADQATRKEAGTYVTSCHVPPNLLNNRTYTAMFYFVRNRNNTMYLAEELLTFEVLDAERPEGSYLSEYVGPVRPQLEWSMNKVSSI